MLIKAWKRGAPGSLSGWPFGRPAGACFALGLLLVWLPSIPAAAERQISDTPDLNDLRVRFLTEATEIRIGRRASRRFERRNSLVEDVAVQEYVDRIAQTIATSSGVTVPVTIKVVDATEVNAVSFPGGFLYVSRGLILEVDDEAEIAAVLAHEIAHVVTRDGLRNNRNVGMDFGGDPLIIEFPDGAEANVFERDLTVLETSPRSLREIDADERAMHYLQGAGYNPRSLLGFLEMMQAEEAIGLGEVPPMFQTHPALAERIGLVRERIEASPVTNNPSAGASRDALLEIKARLMQPESNLPRPD